MPMPRPDVRRHYSRLFIARLPKRRTASPSQILRKVFAESRCSMLTDYLAERRKRRCEQSLLEFFREAWKVLEPETRFIDSWHYQLIAEYLELVTRGQFRKRFPGKIGIIFNQPPRTAKSSLITICWPCWSWIAKPSLRFLCASYSDQLASEHSVARR